MQYVRLIPSETSSIKFLIRLHEAASFHEFITRVNIMRKKAKQNKRDTVSKERVVTWI